MPSAAEFLTVGRVLLLGALGLLGLWALHRGALPGIGFRGKPRRETPLWGGLEVLACLIVFFLAMSSTGALLAGSGGRALGDALLNALALTVADAIACAFVFLVVTKHFRQPLRTLGLETSPWRNYPAVAAAFVFSYLPLVLVSGGWKSALDGLGFDVEDQAALELFRESIESGDALGLAAMTVAAVVVAPVAEEILFRGFFHGMLRCRWGTGLAAVVSSGFFALFHANVAASLPLFAIGLLLSYIYEKTGSLYPAMAYHAAFNFTSLAVVYAQLPVA